MATVKVHWGKPIWTTAGGAELPLTNAAIAAAIGLVGPGRYSVDRALGIRLPWWVSLVGLAGIAATVGRAVQPQPEPEAPAADDLAPAPAEEPVPLAT
jgi:putative oxidoreductase